MHFKTETWGSTGLKPALLPSSPSLPASFSYFVEGVGSHPCQTWRLGCPSLQSDRTNLNIESLKRAHARIPPTEANISQEKKKCVVTPFITACSPDRSAYSPTPVRNAEKELSPPGRRPSRARSENLDSSEVCRLDLDTAMQELETFIPHVRTLSAAHVKQLARRDLTRFRNFRQEGNQVPCGGLTPG